MAANLNLTVNTAPGENNKNNEFLVKKYTEPALKINEAQTLSQKRIKQTKLSQVMDREQKVKEMLELNSIYSSSLMSVNKSKKLTLDETENMLRFEKERHDRLIGQLKAAEARNRAKILKLKYYNCKQDEIENLIESQSSALKAVRLEAFLPPVKPEKLNVPDTLNSIQRRRLEALIDDPANSLIERRLY